MGQKVHPYGFRLGYNKDWHSHWFAKRQYGYFLVEDLKLKRELKKRFTGAGVFYGATLAEAANYRGEEVVVVGGANSAGQAAMMFSRFAERVTVLVRGPSIADGMSRYLIDQIEATPRIEVLTQASVADARGNDHLEEVVIRDGRAAKRQANANDYAAAGKGTLTTLPASSLLAR